MFATDLKRKNPLQNCDFLVELSYRNSESSYRSYWTRGSLDRALHHGRFDPVCEEEG